MAHGNYRSNVHKPIRTNTIYFYSFLVTIKFYKLKPIKIEMIEQDMLDKVRNFHQLQRKVHLTKIPSIKFPKGKWHNGMIVSYLADKKKIIFLDDDYGPIEIFFFEIGDVELWREEIRK